MVWEKKISRRAASDGGWKDDFPLGHDLPEEITLDCRALELPIYPLFVVRMRTFLAWHIAEGRSLRVLRPEDRDARRLFDSLQVTAGLPVTSIAEMPPGPSRTT